MKANQKKFSAFKKAGLQDWEVAAQEELNGANPFEKLTDTVNGLSIKPFYAYGKSVHPPPLLPPSQNNFLGPRTWFNCPRIQVQDAKKANHTALECLRQGADGIFFELDIAVNMKVLLKDIEWPVCSLNFLVKKNPDQISEAIAAFVKEKKIKGKVLHGALICATSRETFSQVPFHEIGFPIKATTPVGEITEGFSMMISSLKGKLSSHMNRIAFSMMLGTDFFSEVAKLRAMRMVWDRCVVSTKTKKKTPLFIHAWVPAWVDQDYDPHGNMLKNTTAAMAAILGGCDVLTVEPEDNKHPMMSRVALNVSNILREESYLSSVADPLAGSYYIEDLSRQMADAAWKSIKPLLPS